MLRARKLASAVLTASLVTAGGIGTTVLSASAAQADACPTASQIVTGINAVVAAAGGVSSGPGALTTSSSPDDVQSAAQSTVAGLNTIVNDLSVDVTALGGCSAPLSPADAQTVTDAFHSLTGATQQMLSTLTGNQAIFAQFGQTAPIASSLRALELTLDSYTFALIGAAASQQNAITNDKNSVDGSLGDAITGYQQICIPSPLYPTVMPICVGM